MLPRIPLLADPQPFIAAGRALSELHLGYEAQDSQSWPEPTVARGGDLGTFEAKPWCGWHFLEEVTARQTAKTGAAAA